MQRYLDSCLLDSTTNFLECTFMRIKFDKNEDRHISNVLIMHIIGAIHSILLHRTTLGGELYTYCRFVPCGSEQPSSNCIYVLPNTMSIRIINNKLDLLTLFHSIWLLD